MSRKDSAMAAKHAQMLRELIKKPENKMCADCKKNDTRWASWNIGVFVCIRCSGVHRGMGVHISRVKSVDLDTWGEREMESIMKWGNHRANLYWEAHLRPGHIPPDHKMESFIRSKYEARKWAREGPPPEDPSVLESGEGAAAPITSSSPPPVQVQAKAQASVAQSRPLSPPRTTRQPQAHQLLSATSAGRASSVQRNPPAAAATPAPAPEVPEQPKPQDDLFSLDFHSPPPGSENRSASVDLPKKDVKQDILSLFGKTAAAAPVQPQADPFAAWGSSTQQPAPQSTSMMGGSGTGMWGVQSGWNAPPTQSPPAFAAQQQPSNVWAWNSSSTTSPSAQPQQNNMQGLFEGQSVWGATGAQQTATGIPTTTSNDLFGTSFSSTSTSTTTKKADDPFGDIWGDFK
ncbi:ArfGap-domain-containing protein [Schizopora paradoxa]|uniref:ArfGap-domain-containing protein n=1 Tax=Schizopora paradoxa TaxID=27342 RepID=A0A0H2RI07_9AGAM|nr:ArfGap-domain-containing protein [Schizopora paradoxa]